MILAVFFKMIVTITNININITAGNVTALSSQLGGPTGQKSHCMLLGTSHCKDTSPLAKKHHAKESGARTWQWLQDKTRARGGFRHLNSEMIHVNGFIQKLGYTANPLMNHHIHFGNLISVCLITNLSDHIFFLKQIRNKQWFKHTLPRGLHTCRDLSTHVASCPTLQSQPVTSVLSTSGVR